MADATRNGPGEGAALLRRLRRLTVRAESANASDRAQLIALIDDIKAVRRRLKRECTRLDEELQRATVRVTAINAYARSARAVSVASRRGH
jgi:hypothetical protein